MCLPFVFQFVFFSFCLKHWRKTVSASACLCAVLIGHWPSGRRTCPTNRNNEDVFIAHRRLVEFSNPSIHPVGPSVPSLRPVSLRPSIPSACPPVRLSACPSVRLSACPPVRLSACPSVRLSACSPVRLSAVRLFPAVCSSVTDVFRLFESADLCPTISACFRVSQSSSGRAATAPTMCVYVCVCVAALDVTASGHESR